MTRKTILLLILVLILGIALGTGGTIAVQKFILKTPVTANAVEEKPKKDGPLVDIGEFTVNLKGGSFLKTTITVEGTDKKAEEVLKEKDAFMKDRVNTVLANKSLSDIQSPSAREKLRKELISSLNEVAEDKIQNVLFLTFVYQ